jgi:signal transduction histidine kinase
VKIVVIDSGEAIISEVQNQMFSKGFTSKGDSHLGMGLSMARELLDLYQGTLTYEPDNGFIICLPLAS